MLTIYLLLFYQKQSLLSFHNLNFFLYLDNKKSSSNQNNREKIKKKNKNAIIFDEKEDFVKLNELLL